MSYAPYCFCEMFRRLLKGYLALKSAGLIDPSDFSGDDVALSGDEFGSNVVRNGRFSPNRSF